MKVTYPHDVKYASTFETLFGTSLDAVHPHTELYENIRGLE